jgi:site-specific recombinase XerD
VLVAMHGPHELRNRALFTLQFATGMRVGELATLTVADLISCGEVRRSFRLRKEHTKYGRAREVFLSA